MSFYRAFRYPWQGQPLAPPTVAASLNNTGEETIVHASWNGATGVASWRVLAGSSPQSLKTLSAIPSESFESSTHPAGAATPTSRSRRWTAPDGTLASSNPTKVGSYAASLLDGPRRVLELSAGFGLVFVAVVVVGVRRRLGG